MAKALLEHCGADVSSTQVYNHLRKWRLRWLTMSRLRDVSGA
jgi:site-specific recombinase XerD